MDWMEIVKEIFEIVVIPLLGVGTVFLITLIKKKTSEITEKIDNETLQKYVNMLSDTITTCVISTNQTYVDTLKKQGKFDAEAQKAAFDMTLTSVLAVLNDEAKRYLEAAYGDLNTYLTKQIEATVNANKIEISE